MSMQLKIIFLLAQNTFKEILRDRIFYLVASASFLLIGFSVALGSLSFFEQFRITNHVSFMCIHITSAIICIFLGCVVIRREIENKTIFTLLTRPIDRWQLLLGKILGMISIILFVLFCLSFVLFFILFGLSKNLNFTSGFLLTLYGIFLEAILLIAVCALTSPFLSFFMAVSSTSFFFLIGHFQHTLNFFIERSDSIVFKIFAGFIVTFFPDLEKFNWRSLIVYDTHLPLEDVFKSSLYSFSYFTLITSVALLLFQRRNFD